MEFIPSFDQLTPWIFTFLFGAVALIQLFWSLFFYLRIALHKHTQGKNFPPVSVIITARNEEDNLFRLLPKILEQDYDNYEVIVVNHQSIDDSAHILKAFERNYSHLKVIELERSKHIKNGKKLPLTIAIKGASHEHLLFTDADCDPSSVHWIKEMASQFTTQEEIVLGYAPYEKEPGLLNRIIRLDTVMIALNYLSYAKAGAAYMGVGRNMGYTKRLFMNNNGFKSHYAVQSGDDDLFIQEVATRKNVTVCISPNAFCASKAEKTWGDWYKQKGRHFTTANRYKVIKKLLLGIYPLTLLLLYISFITLCLYSWLCWTTIGVFGFVILIKWLVQGRAMFVLHEKEFAWAFPFWDICYALIAPIVYYTTEKSTDTKWK